MWQYWVGVNFQADYPERERERERERETLDKRVHSS